MKETVYSVRFPQLQQTVEVRAGSKLLDAAAQVGITFGQLCGGTGICKRCTMKTINARGDEETVLACLTPVESDLEVQLPDQLPASGEHHVETKTFPISPPSATASLDPLTQKIHLSLSAPDLADNRGDLERLLDSLRQRLNMEITGIGLSALRALPTALRDNDWSVTATVTLDHRGAGIIAIEGGDTTARQVMVAVDIGTTTIAAQLLDSGAGSILAATSLLNSQAIYGSDVTSRVMAAEKQSQPRLQEAIVRDLNTAVDSLCAAAGIEPQQIHTMVCAGNTIMCHFLLGLPTSNIRRSPYIAATTLPDAVSAAELGIAIHPKGSLYCLPAIGSWVGGDITAGIYESRLQSREEISLLMDIGTNGEIVIGTNDWLMACSASAGPALEGAGVECGMRAADGAIERVTVENGLLTTHTIGLSKPKGICGSGIIDLVAALLNTGVIDRSGAFTEAGKRSFTLVPAAETAHGRDISISEGDIENIMNAKAALYAAMHILLKRLSLDFSCTHRFYIAGGFGNYIDIKSAVAIGLLPDLAPETFVFAGNTSLAGARSAALDRAVYKDLRQIAQTTTYFDLMGADDYMEEFMKALFLPHTDIHEFHSNRHKKRTS